MERKMDFRGLVKFTLVDYPGKIGCIIFSGGCNLRCPFCHNPCLVFDPASQPRVTEKEFFHFLERRRGLLEGVVFSGGEPLLQAAFCAELFRLLKRECIHTAVDTCGEVPWSAFETVLPVADLFLFDFKHPDSEAHRRLTGSGNGRIKANLLRLGRNGCPVEIRIPLIPGLNMEDETLKRSAEFLAGIGTVTAVRLLAYHSLARSKYEAVGRADTMPRVGSPGDDAMRHAAELIGGFGLRAMV